MLHSLARSGQMWSISLYIALIGVSQAKARLCSGGTLPTAAPEMNQVVSQEEQGESYPQSKAVRTSNYGSPKGVPGCCARDDGAVRQGQARG